MKEVKVISVVTKKFDPKTSGALSIERAESANLQAEKFLSEIVVGKTIVFPDNKGWRNGSKIIKNFGVLYCDFGTVPVFACIRVSKNGVVFPSTCRVTNEHEFCLK